MLCHTRHEYGTRRGIGKKLPDFAKSPAKPVPSYPGVSPHTRHTIVEHIVSLHAMPSNPYTLIHITS